MGHGRLSTAQQIVAARACKSKARHGHCFGCGARVTAVGGRSLCKDCK